MPGEQPKVAAHDGGDEAQVDVDVVGLHRPDRRGQLADPATRAQPARGVATRQLNVLAEQSERQPGHRVARAAARLDRAEGRQRDEPHAVAWRWRRPTPGAGRSAGAGP